MVLIPFFFVLNLDLDLDLNLDLDIGLDLNNVRVDPDFYVHVGCLILKRLLACSLACSLARSLACVLPCVFPCLFERSEFLIATSQKKNLCVCSNLGFSGEKNCACVRLILVLV